jgi:uncharacterized membrane protein YbhN (UPF0104 family)
LIQVFVGAMRWKEISALCGAPPGLTQAFRYNMIGTFFYQTLPSTIGGDAMRWLVKHTGAGWRAATYSVLVDRAIGLIALALLVVASLPWSYELIANTRAGSRLSRSISRRFPQALAFWCWAPCRGPG